MIRDRRPLAGGLRLVQLPRVRPRPRDHRRRPRVPRRVGNAPELVAAARQPGALRGDRGAAHRAARLRGLARAADDHAHPHVGDPAARGLGDDLPRRARTQDDLRRLPGRALARRGGPALPLRGSRPSRRAAARRGRPHAARVHGRRQQHDRQRAGPAGVRRGRPPPRRAALRRRRPRVRRHRRARRGRAVALRAARQQRRPPRRRELRRDRARRRLLEGLLVAARLHRLPDRGQAAAEGRRAAVPVLRARRRSPRWPPCSPASTSTSAAATRSAPSSTRSPPACSTALDRLDIETPNRSGLPIIEIPLRDYERIDDVGRFLFERGVYVTLAAYPLVPKDEVGFRVQLTAANTVEEVDRADRGARGAGRARRAPQRARGRRADRAAA